MESDPNAYAMMTIFVDRIPITKVLCHAVPRAFVVAGSYLRGRSAGELRRASCLHSRRDAAANVGLCINRLPRLVARSKRHAHRSRRAQADKTIGEAPLLDARGEPDTCASYEILRGGSTGAAEAR